MTRASFLLCCLLSIALMFTCINAFAVQSPRQHSSRQCSSIMVSATEDDIDSSEDVLLYSDDDGEQDDDEAPEAKLKKNKRWKKLSPKVKLRVIREAQERAIANKKKHEPAQDKKRRKQKCGMLCVFCFL